MTEIYKRRQQNTIMVNNRVTKCRDMKLKKTGMKGMKGTMSIFKINPSKLQYHIIQTRTTR